MKPETNIEFDKIPERNDQKNLKVLVTGSTSGIGKQTALSLARLGCDVHVHGRDVDKGEAVTSQIRDVGVNSEFHRVDFSNISEVKQFSEDFSDKMEAKDGLDILVNNAGGYFRNSGKTEDDIEYTFAVNHLSHFILTRHLLPLLESSEIGEIINVSSSAHKSARQMDLSTVSGDNVTGGWKAYGRSKLANIHFTKSLDRRMRENEYDINVNAIHPGGIPSSGFLRTFPNILYKMMRKLGQLPVFDTPEDGAETILYALFSFETKGDSGEYYKDTEVTTPTELARNKKKQKELWDKSVALTDTSWSEIF